MAKGAAIKINTKKLKARGGDCLEELNGFMAWWVGVYYREERPGLCAVRGGSKLSLRALARLAG